MTKPVKKHILVSVFIVVLVLHACQASRPEIQEFHVRTPEVTLYARAAGNLESKNTLIAINGGPGLSSHYMLNLERLAGPKFAVVTYDQRAVGRSTSVPMDPANFELLDYVADLEALRTFIGVENIHLLGHSWGGIVALRYATLYPERVRSIVLLNSGPPSWEGLTTCFSGIRRRFAELQNAGVIPRDIAPGTEEYNRAFLTAYFSDPTFWFSPEEDGAPPEINQQVNQLTWSALEYFDLSSIVTDLSHRILVVWGIDDPCGLAVGESIVEALPAADIKFVLLRDCGHFWHECPDLIFPQLHSFLDITDSP